MEVVDVLKLLRSHPQGSFLDLVEFNGHCFGTADAIGVAPGWEMHPDTDEFFYIIEGEFEMTLLFDDGPQHIKAPGGSAFVVPQGIWHKPGAPSGARFVYFTPGESLTSDKDDPRA